MSIFNFNHGEYESIVSFMVPVMPKWYLFLIFNLNCFQGHLCIEPLNSIGARLLPEKVICGH